MKDYTKLLVKFMIFLAVLAVVDCAGGCLFRALSSKALEVSPHGMVLENSMLKVESEGIIIGASEAKHSIVSKILEDSLGFEFYNCGIDGARFYSQNTLINSMLDRYSPKMIIWSVKPDLYKAPSQKEKDRLSKMKPFFQDHPAVREALLMKSKYEPIKLISHTYRYNSTFVPYLQNILMPNDSYEYGGYQPLKGTNKGMKIFNRQWKEKYDGQAERAFRNTVERCKQCGAQLVFVLVPRYEVSEYSDLKSYKSLKKIAQVNDILFIEDFYQNDSLMKPEYFKDILHMNSVGAPIFTRMLASRMASGE